MPHRQIVEVRSYAMARQQARAAVSVESIEEQVTKAAYLFVQEILRVLGNSTLVELALLTGRGSPVDEREEEPAALEGEPKRSPRTMAAVARVEPERKVSKRISSVRKAAGTKPVECPVPGCREP